MKKVWLCCLCALLCATLLCSCTQTANTPSSNTSTPSSAATTTTTTTQTPDDDPRPVVDLPQADEQTIRWTLDFPDDLKPSTYQTPQLVAPKDFAWGEYVPFVEFEGEVFAYGECQHTRAFLGPNALDLQQGERLYQAFNDLYKTVYPPASGIFETPTQLLPEDEALRQVLFESSVVAISPDLQRVETFGYLYKGIRSDPSELDLCQQAWATEYKIYQNGHPDLVYQSPELDHFYDTYDYHAYYYQTNRFQDPVRYSGYPDWNNGKYLMNRIRDDEKRQELYCIYSIEEDRMLYQVAEPFGLSCEIDGYTVYANPERFVLNGRYLLVDFWCTKEIENSPYYGDFIPFLTSYLFDLQTGTWQHLEDFANYIAFSPDGKYMAYTNWMHENTLPEQPGGLYVKNLQDGTTTFYPCETHGGLVDRVPFAPLGFVHYDTLMQKIGQ